MYDAYRVNMKYREPLLLHGRFTGAGTSVPTAVANTSKGLSAARTGVGALTLTLSDLPVGIIQSVQAWVVSADKANAKVVMVTPPAAGATSLTLQVVTAANTQVAADLSTSDELDVQVWTARTQVP